MLTFSALTSTSFRLAGGPTTVTVFPESADKAGAKEITLLSKAQEKDTDGAISWPGEYNLGGISIKGIGHDGGKQVSYVADVDGIRCAFLSAPVNDWTDKQIEAVGDVDVMVLPAAETKLTQKLVDEFDPRVLILLPGDDKTALAAVEKVIGVKERVSEYKMKGSLPSEGREVVVLQ